MSACLGKALSPLRRREPAAWPLDRIREGLPNPEEWQSEAVELGHLYGL
ncbi:hypothetical protein [Thermus sp.]